MIINDKNLYDICFDENIILVGVSCLYCPLTEHEQLKLHSNFFFKTLTFGFQGDYECLSEMRESILVLKPQFFWKRENDQVSDLILRIIDDYGGKVISNVCDIIEI